MKGNVMRKIEGLMSLRVTPKKQIKFIEYIYYFKQMEYAAVLHTHFLFMKSNIVRYADMGHGSRLIEALTKSPNGALFSDILNDTIISIRSGEIYKPSFVFGVPDDLKPNLSNETDSENKKVKLIYI